MSDLISKASVCEILADMYPFDGERVVEVERINKAYDAVLNLPSPPSAQPEIVHCRDCANCYTDEVFKQMWCNGRKVTEGDYCSRAKRKENA